MRPRRSLNNSLKLRNLRPQFCQLSCRLCYSPVVGKQFIFRLRLKHVHACQIAPLTKTKAFISERRYKWKHCVNSILFFSLYEPSQSTIREQNAQLCYLLFLSKVFKRTRNRVLLIIVSQRSTARFQWPQIHRAQSFLLFRRTLRAALSLVWRQVLNDTQIQKSRHS